MKAFDVLFCFFDTYGEWKPIRIYGVDIEDAMARARKDAVDSGITGGLYFERISSNARRNKNVYVQRFVGRRN